MSAGIDADAKLEADSKFSALCEAVVFDTIAKKPFFEVIKNIKPCEILKAIKELDITLPRKFTYNEYYSLLLSFSKTERRDIIECFSLQIKEFNNILTALETEDFDSFSNALNECESTEWLGWLVTLQYICYGTLKLDFPYHCKNLWLSGLGFETYFRNMTGSAATDFLKQEQSKWSGILQEPTERRRMRAVKNINSDFQEIMNLEEAMKGYSSLFTSLSDLWNSSYYKNWTDYKEIHENAVLTADVIFKDEFYHNNRAVPKTENEHTDWADYLNDLDWIAVNDVEPLRCYVSASAAAMVEIFHIVRTLFPKEIYSALRFILQSNPYTAKAIKIKADNIADTAPIKASSIAVTSELIKEVGCNDNPEYLNTENCVRRFIDENFDFAEDKKKYFMDTYQRSLVEFILSIKNSKAFYSLVYLIYPIKKLPGKGAYNHIEKGKHLERGIYWKNEPNDSDGVCERLIYHIPYLELYRNVGKDTKSPAKCINKLVEEVRNGNRWIKSFIEDYWSNDPMTDFKEKLKDASK